MALAFWAHVEIDIFVYLFVFYVISGLLILPELVATLKKENWAFEVTNCRTFFRTKEPQVTKFLGVLLDQHLP